MEIQKLGLHSVFCRYIFESFAGKNIFINDDINQILVISISTWHSKE